MSSPPTPPQIQLITPNSPAQTPLYPTTIFLAGPTDVPWRENFIALFAQHLKTSKPTPAPPPAVAVAPPAVSGFTIYDPIQPNWDSTWKEDYELDPRFQAQTDWELDRQESAGLVVVFFDERAKAPVSLLELGLCARSGRAVVGCQKGFWKRGHVQGVCHRFGVPLGDDLEALVVKVIAALKT